MFTEELFVYKDPSKNFMLAFESDDMTEVANMNSAILNTLKEWEMQPFHQIQGNAQATTFGSDPGFHGWEVWVKTTEAFMNELIPIVLERYEKNKTFFEAMGF